MNYGRFFEYDFESSRLPDGVAVFNYRWLQDNDGNDDTPRYPIYLTFTSEVIVFNLHYIDEATKSHYHNPIIELFLSPNLEISDGLSETLNESFYNEFPLKKDKHLRSIIRKSYERDCEQGVFLSDDNYSSLDIFEVETASDYPEEDPSKATHFLRKLILDFLYDFEYTSVFKNLAYYNEVSIKLRENFLFNALMNKMRYYYCRMRLVGDELYSILDCKETSDSILEKELKFLFQRYENVESDWVDSIINPKSAKAFHYSPWFGENHEELEQVYRVKRLSFLRRHKKKNKLEQRIEPISEMSTIPPLATKDNIREIKRNFLSKEGISRENTFGLTVSTFLNLIDKKRNKKYIEAEDNGQESFEKSKSNHKKTAKNAARWDVDHYQFLSLLRVWCGDKKTMIMSTFILLGIIGVLVGFFFLLHYNKSLKIDTGWEVIIIFLIGVILAIVSRVFMRKYRRINWGNGFMMLIMPRILAAVITAWLTMCIGQDLFEKFIDQSYNWSSIIILSFITLCCIAYESRALTPYDSWLHWLFSAFVVFAIAYIYAIVSGILVYDFFGTKIYINGAEEKPDPYVFIPQFAFFATFIGIFLQLMFQGKSITKTE